MYVSYPFRGSVTYFIALFLTVVLGFSFSCFKSAELYWVSAHFISGKLHLRIFKLGELTYNRSYQDYLELLKMNKICSDCIKLCLYSLLFAYRMINSSPKTKNVYIFDEISKLKKWYFVTKIVLTYGEKKLF